MCPPPTTSQPIDCARKHLATKRKSEKWRKGTGEGFAINGKAKKSKNE